MKDTEIEFAYQYVENMGMLSEVPELLQKYFDYEAFAKDLFLEGYSQYEGHFFHGLIIKWHGLIEACQTVSNYKKRGN